MAKWYEDWLLSVTGYDDGMARIDITLPHNDPAELSIWTTKEQMTPLANTLDKMLCELTGTKKGIDNGRIEPGRPGKP